mmetsp:Transcript_23880/g.80552  ORF Transcript_23880/g.80552 Transcript_23880/m.80552 type:complete len:95 (-) Transcript_23880:39-323(-)
METTKVLEERWLALEAEYAAIMEAEFVREKEAAALVHVIDAEGEEAFEVEEKNLEAQLEYGGYDSFDDYDRYDSLDEHYGDVVYTYFLEDYPLS